MVLYIPNIGRKYSHTNSYNFAMTPISQDDHNQKNKQINNKINKQDWLSFTINLD